jgi:hypothetical protein
MNASLSADLARVRAAPDTPRVYLGSDPIPPGELLAAVAKGLER